MATQPTAHPAPRTGASNEWEPSAAFLGSLAAACLFFAIGGSTNTLVWAIFGSVWAAIGIAVSLWHRHV